jgi:hypothetical protein
MIPAKDTTYQLVVHDTSGYVGVGELNIHIYSTDAVNLGNTTAICRGDHAIFSVNGNFVSYDWLTDLN